MGEGLIKEMKASLFNQVSYLDKVDLVHEKESILPKKPTSVLLIGQTINLSAMLLWNQDRIKQAWWTDD